MTLPVRTALAVPSLLALALGLGVGCCPEHLVAVPPGASGLSNNPGSGEDDAGLIVPRVDAGSSRDAGIEPLDAGELRDAGPADAGPIDLDAGVPDAGPVDAGQPPPPPPPPPPDAGPQCAPSPDLTGDWSMTSDYDLSQVVQSASLLQAINDINSFLNTLALLGAPIPQWVLNLFGDLSNLSALYQDIHVLSDLTLAAAPPSGPDTQYQAQETWQQVLVQQNGSWIPLDGGTAGFTSPPGYGVQVCGTDATFDQHDLSAALGGLVNVLLDAITNIATCSNSGPCYSSFNQAVQAALDCSQYTGSAQVTCQLQSAALLSEIQNALSQIAVGFGAAKVAGTAQVPDGTDITQGVWAGTAFGATFPGTFSATKN